MMSQVQPVSESNIRTPSLLSKLQYSHLQKAVSTRQIALNKLTKVSVNNSPCKSPALRFKPSPMRNILDSKASEQESQPKPARFVESKVPCRTNHRNAPTEEPTPESSFFISPRFQIDKRQLFRSKDPINLTEIPVDKENRPSSVLSTKKVSHPDISLMEFRRQSDQSCFLQDRPSSNDSFQLLRRKAINMLEKRSSPLNRKFTSPGPELDAKNEFGKVKKVVILRRLQSRSPDDQQFGRNLSEMLKNPPSLYKLGERVQKHRISLNEMITIKKLRTTENNGVIKKVLHAPTMSIFDLQEEPIKFNNHLKEWVEIWKDRSLLNNTFAKIYTCFWNSPEGSISVLLEPAKKGTLQDLLDVGLTYPESCLKVIAKSLMNSLQEIHKNAKAAHWLINPKEIIIDLGSNPKLSPGLARHAKFCAEAAELVFRQQRSLNKERSSFNSQPERKGSYSEQPQIGRLHANETSQYFASDIFDLGHCLLTCALGDLTLFDASNFYSLNNLKYLMDLIKSFKQTSKNWCCLLHNENDLRKFQAGLNSTVRLKHSLKCVLENNFVGSKIVQPEQQNTNQTDCCFTLLELLKRNNRFSEGFLHFLCLCTRIDLNQRFNPAKFLSHEFLADHHKAQGVNITLAELLNSMHNQPIRPDARSNQPSISTSQELELNRIFDAIKLVMLNCDKSFMRQLLQADNLQNPKSTTHKKLHDLALVLNVPFNNLMDKFKTLISLE